ncbi:N-acetylglucosamine-6-phosphate deacetylase [Shimia sediminis]|uniref:N-acetylglucosamine-6-phosphate deacetylase n=1 Tax=Shimia sediminis TaxID=2497945 RepID=UPI000F8E1BB9|nr:N-acetylglucosamine-6-phosphate deacetylase [Shimia sediminis]
MTMASLTFRNGRIFDGVDLHETQAAHFENGRFAGLVPEADMPSAEQEIDLGGDILFPGFVDLQVNGGDGVLFNSDPSVATLRRMAAAHRRLGVTAFLPTLITDTRDKTRAAVNATQEAIRMGVTGIAGLHLEGPHLSIARKGAHDATLIRAMEAEDLDILLKAATALPRLKVTVAPENVTEAQVTALAETGVLVSLGHSDADNATSARYIAAGARCVTHLFNAMSQLGNREPGLVGAALSNGNVHAGLIADAVHVHPDTIRAAWKAKTGPGQIFLVSDAMAVAGTDATEFELGDRLIRRNAGVLTLADGTLAGADLDLSTAVRVMVEKVGVDLASALRAATSIPAALVGLDYRFDEISNVVRLTRGHTGGTYIVRDAVIAS